MYVILTYVRDFFAARTNMSLTRYCEKSHHLVTKYDTKYDTLFLIVVQNGLVVILYDLISSLPVWRKRVLVHISHRVRGSPTASISSNSVRDSESVHIRRGDMSQVVESNVVKSVLFHQSCEPRVYRLGRHCRGIHLVSI